MLRYSVYYSSSDKDNESTKTLYIRDVTFYIDKNEETVSIYHYGLPFSPSPFCEEACALTIYSCGFHFDGKKLLSAYPEYIGPEDLRKIFPNCCSIFINYADQIELDSFAIFPNLQRLGINSAVRENLNGVEFLSSLQELELYGKYGSTKHIDLSLLNLLRLERLFLRIEGKTCIRNLNIESLKKLETHMCRIDNLENIVLPNLTTLRMSYSHHGLLSTFKIPDGCKIYFNYPSDPEVDASVDVIRKKFPNMSFEIIQRECLIG
jgi:hypothetical protein